MNRFTLFAALALVLSTASVRATSIDPTNGLAVADVTIDFGTVGIVGDASNLFASQGVVFSGLTGTVGVVSSPVYSGFSGAHLSAGGSSLAPTSLTNAFEIQFSGAVTAAAFRLVTNPGTSRFITYLAGTQVEEYSTTTSVGTGINWFGFENSSFDTLRLEPGGTNGVVHIDDLRFSGLEAAAPEPPALALVGLGLVLVRLRRGRTA